MNKKYIISLIILLNIFHQTSFATNNHYNEFLDSKYFNEKNIFVTSENLYFDSMKNNSKRNLIICDANYENDFFSCDANDAKPKSPLMERLYFNEGDSKSTLLVFTVIDGTEFLIIPKGSVESTAKIREVNRFVSSLEKSEFLNNEKYEMPSNLKKEGFITNQLFLESVDYVYFLTFLIVTIHFIKFWKQYAIVIKIFFIKFKHILFLLTILLIALTFFIMKFQIDYYYSAYTFITQYLEKFNQNTNLLIYSISFLLLVFSLIIIKDNNNRLINLLDFRNYIIDTYKNNFRYVAASLLLIILLFNRSGESSAEIYVLVIIILLLSNFKNTFIINSKISIFILSSIMIFLLTISFIRYQNQTYLYKDLIDKGNFITLPKKLTINGTEKIKNDDLYISSKAIFMDSYLIYYPSSESIEIKKNDQFQIDSTSILTFKSKESLFKFLNKNLENKEKLMSTTPTNVFYVNKYFINNQALLKIEYNCINNLYKYISVNDKKIGNLGECKKDTTAKLSIDISNLLKSKNFYEINFDNNDIKKMSIESKDGQNLADIVFYNVNKNYKYTMEVNVGKSNKIINYVEDLDENLILENNFIKNLNEISKRNLVENSFVIWGNQGISVVQNK